MSKAYRQYQVRGVVFPDRKSLFSASRDSTVRRWQLLSLNPPKYDCSISSHASSFINAVTYLPPSKDCPEGLVISGGKDTIIEAKEVGKPPEDNAEALMLGHAHNICALDVSPKGDFIVSGSWDGTARLWRVGKWEHSVILEGHEGSVWAVLAYDFDMIVTGKLVHVRKRSPTDGLSRYLGCADKLIRLYAPNGRQLSTIKGSSDVVRALCRIPKSHPSNAQFASAGNDAIIRLWRFDGQQMGELYGHESFIYSLVSSPSGELISSGEDRTVRIWRGSECVQTITHPAISVWCVAVCPENGDISSGASDKKVRVFSRENERIAAPEAIQAFEDSVKASSIPKQQVDDGNVNQEKLPGPEFLEQKSGTKEGQVVMIREANNTISAHQWSVSAQRWMNVGTVVDQVGSSGRKTHHQGKDYDYVFDVDIEDGKPPLKLPYNVSQNPYEAATKFIQDNELPMTYLDQVANFITTNTQGATLGQQAPEPAGADPWSSGRYIPGEGGSAATPSPAPFSRPKVLPQTSYLSIKTANLRTIKKKTEELNQQLISEGASEIALDQAKLRTLSDMIAPLETALSSGPQSNPALSSGVELILDIVSKWPPSHVLPALDLLRLLAAATPTTAVHRTAGGESVVNVLSTSGVFEDLDRPNNIMLATRVFSNLFETSEGRALAHSAYSKIHDLVQSASSAAASNRTLAIAVATLYVNYAVLLTSEEKTEQSSSSSSDRGLELLDDLTAIIKKSSDAEAVYRALVAFGTLLSLGEELTLVANEIYDAEGALRKAEQSVKEPRVKGVIGEIRALLKG